jgi:hypothetical protein
MIFRARDKNAALVIAYYKKLCSNLLHKRAVNLRLHDFVGFALDHPDRMKEPDTNNTPPCAEIHTPTAENRKVDELNCTNCNKEYHGEDYPNIK